MKITCDMLLIAALAGCTARAQRPAVRFANVPAVTIVDDRRDVPDKPEVRRFLHGLYHYSGVFQRRMTRALELPRQQRARGVNALDEVPSSTWFTNRIGVRDLTIDEVRAGPITSESPERHRPWTVRSTKPSGSEGGFIVTDARGVKFLLKFDGKGLPEVETAAHVIVGKLLWACGYNVPQDLIVYFRPADLVLAPDAVIVDPLGDKPLDREELDRRLADLEPTSDGRIRALASRWLPGQEVGGHPEEGVRHDDPNDRIPHELRRDLRGAFSIYAWLDHVDVQEGNFLDLWVEGSRDWHHHYLEHYTLDFGKALGVMAVTVPDPRRGHEYVVDFAQMSRSLLTVGLVKRPWEGRAAPNLRGVGLFESNSYDPGAWKPDFPSYLPFLTADRIDKFWGAKILMRFSRDQIHAIVETAQLSDPRAVEYLTDTLVARQRATAFHWFSQTNPLDRFTVAPTTRGFALCFDDLMLSYRLAPVQEATQYVMTGYNAANQPLGTRYVRKPDGQGHACFPLTISPAFDEYTIVELDTTRPGFFGTTYVHIARDPTSGAPRVIGVWRS